MMDYGFRRSGSRFCIIVDLQYFVIIMFLLLVQYFEMHVCEVKLGREFSTKYGIVRGRVNNFNGHPRLKPVEVFYGLQYGTTHGRELRYMPPSSPLEHWKGVRLALLARSVCPQPLINETKLKSKFPDFFVRKMTEHAPYTATQTEDCLKLNLFVPTGDEGLPLALQYDLINTKITTATTTTSNQATVVRFKLN